MKTVSALRNLISWTRLLSTPIIEDAYLEDVDETPGRAQDDSCMVPSGCVSKLGPCSMSCSYLHGSQLRPFKSFQACDLAVTMAMTMAL